MISRNRFLVVLTISALFFVFIVFLPFPIKQKIESTAESIGVNKFNLSPVHEDTTVILLGDVMLGRTVMTTSLDKGDPAYPWLKVADELKSADIVFANLENPILENCPRKTDGMVFCADPAMVGGLTFAGIDVATLANNHTLNYGKDGLAQTKKILHENNIEYTDNSLAVKEVNGITFGFLGFEFIDRNITNDHEELVRALNGQVDVLIVGVHWGAEYQAVAGTRQREIAKKLVGAGADVVAGHHPHWVQDTEYIDGVPVYYSLGNFIFDQMWSEETRAGLAVKLTFDSEGRIAGEGKLPIYIEAWAQPRWAEDTEGL